MLKACIELAKISGGGTGAMTVDKLEPSLFGDGSHLAYAGRLPGQQLESLRFELELFIRVKCW